MSAKVGKPKPNPAQESLDGAMNDIKKADSEQKYKNRHFLLIWVAITSMLFEKKDDILDMDDRKKEKFNEAYNVIWNMSTNALGSNESVQNEKLDKDFTDNGLKLNKWNFGHMLKGFIEKVGVSCTDLMYLTDFVCNQMISSCHSVCTVLKVSVMKSEYAMLGEANEALKAENEAFKAENEALKAKNEALKAKNEALKTENELLKKDKIEFAQYVQKNLVKVNKELTQQLNEMKTTQTNNNVVYAAVAQEITTEEDDEISEIHCDNEFGSGTSSSSSSHVGRDMAVENTDDEKTIGSGDFVKIDYRVALFLMMFVKTVYYNNEIPDDEMERNDLVLREDAAVAFFEAMCKGEYMEDSHMVKFVKFASQCFLHMTNAFGQIKHVVNFPSHIKDWIKVFTTFTEQRETFTAIPVGIVYDVNDGEGSSNEKKRKGEKKENGKTKKSKTETTQTKNNAGGEDEITVCISEDEDDGVEDEKKGDSKKAEKKAYTVTTGSYMGIFMTVVMTSFIKTDSDIEKFVNILKTHEHAGFVASGENLFATENKPKVTAFFKFFIQTVLLFVQETLNSIDVSIAEKYINLPKDQFVCLDRNMARKRCENFFVEKFYNPITKLAKDLKEKNEVAKGVLESPLNTAKFFLTADVSKIKKANFGVKKVFEEDSEGLSSDELAYAFGFLACKIFD